MALVWAAAEVVARRVSFFLGRKSRVHFFVFLQIPAFTGNGIPDEIPSKTAFSERKVNSNLKNGILEISSGIPDFLVENVIFFTTNAPNI